jgi:hypothetical protein
VAFLFFLICVTCPAHLILRDLTILIILTWILKHVVITIYFLTYIIGDRLCGLVVRVLGYRSGGSGSIPGTTKKKVVGLERGPLSLMSTTEELLDRKIAAPV